jgi:hypothetical protein
MLHDTTPTVRTATPHGLIVKKTLVVIYLRMEMMMEMLVEIDVELRQLGFVVTC